MTRGRVGGGSPFAWYLFLLREEIRRCGGKGAAMGGSHRATSAFGSYSFCMMSPPLIASDWANWHSGHRYRWTSVRTLYSSRRHSKR